MPNLVRPRLKPPESFRGDFSFANSAEAIARFPFPFSQDTYTYSVNLEPASRGEAGSVFEHPFDVDEHYLSEIEERRFVLQSDPGRCRVLPHMGVAEWDFLELIMVSYARDYPQLFDLQRNGEAWVWSNQALGICDRFTFGDSTSLPLPPFEYIARQAQGDFNLVDQRSGDLFMDGGVITGPADWSLSFDLGMSFRQWHGPVPMAHELGIFDRALKYLLNLQLDRPVRRLNWTMTVHPRLDTSPETYPIWGPDRTKVTVENVGNLVHLRVELQLITRLPRSNGLLFSIRTYLISLDELSSNWTWARRLYKILQALPEEIANYKGISRYRGAVVEWLEPYAHEN
jgi:hypothetical protein